MSKYGQIVKTDAELKPCPFCGGKCYIIMVQGRFYATCDTCTCMVAGPLERESTAAEAIAAWNTRADYHGYQQAAVDAWKRVKAYQERTCKWEYPQGVNGWVGYLICSACGETYDECVTDTAHYCPNCGAKVVEG